jgi:hypothetical protein
MVTALESKTLLTLVSDKAVETVEWSLRRSNGSFENRRLQLLEDVSGVIGYYSEGSAALAADFYEDTRAEARAAGRFRAEMVVLDRTVRIRRGIAWASEPLSTSDDEAAMARLTEITRSELARPYRDTVLANRRQDPESVGWTRITSGAACGFCRLLASKGAIFKKSTANFAAHDNCSCTAAPVFKGGEMGPEADALQYIGSKRKRTPREKQKLREAIAYFESLPPRL